MIYLIMALHTEAKPLLAHWRFKRDKSIPYRLYRNDQMLLLITQMGSKNAANALNALMSHSKPGDRDILINLGLCAAPESYPIGTALLIDRISYGKEDVAINTTYDHALPQASLQTVDEAHTAYHDNAVDMEAYGVYREASGYFSPAHMGFLKIVSDHFKPSDVNKESAITLIQKNIPVLEKMIENMKGESNG